MNKPGIDFIGVSAGAVIQNEKGQLFLAKRSAGARDDNGKWEFPGGSVHMNETRKQAAIRNIRKKYGISIQINGVLGVYDVIDKTAGDHWLSTTFRCSYFSGVPRIGQTDKCDEIGWFDLASVEKLSLSRISKRNLVDLRCAVK